MNLLICHKTPQQKQKTLQKHVKSRKVAHPKRNEKPGKKQAASFCKQDSSYNCIKILRQVEKSTKIIHQCYNFLLSSTKLSSCSLKIYTHNGLASTLI